MITNAEPSDAPSIMELLKASDLPVAGVDAHLATFLIARRGGRVAGCVGLECYDGVGLLRSLVVRPEERGSGLGRDLVERVLDLAREKGLGSIYLLTTTAEDYFPRFGFEVISRAELDRRLEGSEELRGACPDTAICMRFNL